MKKKTRWRTETHTHTGTVEPRFYIMLTSIWLGGLDKAPVKTYSIHSGSMLVHFLQIAIMLTTQQN